MGIREAMDAHPKATKCAVGAMVLISLSVIIIQVSGNHHGMTSTSPEMYFTDDDGRTFFAASPDNVPPFDHNGKQAVSAFVYRCDGQEFVGFMARYKPDTRRKILTTKRVGPEDDQWGRELKKPGDTEWAPASDKKRLAAITTIVGPKGQENVEPVEPGV